MAEQPWSGRLDADTLAAYLDGQLPPEDRERVDAEIAKDPKTYEWVVNTLRVQEVLAATEAEPGRGVPPVEPPLVGGGSLAGEPSPVDPVSEPVVTDPVRSSHLHLSTVERPAPAPMPAPAPVPGPAKVVPFYRRRVVQTGLGALLATAAALMLAVRVDPAWWQRLTGADDVDPRFAKLVEAVGEERNIESRLTGGFKYGPLRSATRGPGDLSNQNLALLAAAGELQKKAQEDPSAENLHAWGVAQLVMGDVDGAIASLAHCAATAPTAPCRADLSAAYLTLARRQNDAALARRGLDEADAWLRMAPGAAEALFNRALALTMLDDHAAAREAWLRYLAVDPDSGWSAEARRRLAERQ